MADIEERFAVYVRERGEHHLRVAALLTGDWHAAEDLVQASLVKLFRAWPKLRLDTDPDAYVRRIQALTFSDFGVRVTVTPPPADQTTRTTVSHLPWPWNLPNFLF